MPMISGAWLRRKGIEQATHHFFAVGHLLDVFGRDEADGVDVLKSRGYKLTQVVHFRFVGIISGRPCQASRGHSMSFTVSVI